MSARAKARMVFYPGLVGLFAGAIAFSTCMPGASHRGALPPPPTNAERALADELRADVVALAGPGARNTETRGSMERASSFVATAFAAAGVAPKRLPYDESRTSRRRSQAARARARRTGVREVVAKLVE